ncbi:unnamed protein product [Boreogadus saida]
MVSKGKLDPREDKRRKWYAPCPQIHMARSGKTNNAEHSLPKELTLDEPSIHLRPESSTAGMRPEYPKLRSSLGL